MSITMKDVFITWNNSLTSANTMKKYNLSVKLYFQMGYVRIIGVNSK